MRRSGKMILLLAVAVALCGGYLAVQHFTQKEVVEAEDVQIQLISAEADDVVDLSWELDGETVTLLKADGQWTLDGDADFPVDQEAVQQLAQAVVGLTANRQLTGVETLSDYGLEEPTFAVTVTMADGEWWLISQGNENALSGDTCVQISGDESVYIVSDAPADAFDVSRSDLMAMDELPEIGDVMQIELSSPEQTLSLRYRSAGSGNYVETDTDRAMDDDAVEAFIEALNAIDWTGCISYQATDEERMQFGLDEPAAQVKVTFSTEQTSGEDDGETVIESGEYTLLLGGTSSDEGSVYAAISADSDMVYTVSSDDAQQIFDALDGSLESASVFSVVWDDVAQVRLSLGGEQLQIERSAQQAEATAEATEAPAEIAEAAETAAAAEAAETAETAEAAEAEEAAESGEWQIDGQFVNAEMWTRFTEAIDALEGADAEAEGAGDVLLTVEIEMSSGAAQTVEFLDSGADAYGIAGETKTVDAAAIDEILRIARHLAK